MTKAHSVLPIKKKRKNIMTKLHLSMNASISRRKYFLFHYVQNFQVFKAWAKLRGIRGCVSKFHFKFFCFISGAFSFFSF